jgi:hypothetical protein
MKIIFSAFKLPVLKNHFNLKNYFEFIENL